MYLECHNEYQSSPPELVLPKLIEIQGVRLEEFFRGLYHGYVSVEWSRDGDFSLPSVARVNVGALLL